MSIFTLHLGAPSHAVEPALLAQRLPRLAGALRRFVASSGIITPNVMLMPENIVHVYAAQLSVQRDHISLDCLPALSEVGRIELQSRVAALAQEFAADGLTFDGLTFLAQSKAHDFRGDTFTATVTNGLGLVAPLGALNVRLALAPAANFIGRDITKALPRSSDATVIRQFVNAAQMMLHQSPVKHCSVNSLWCSALLPADALSQTWLQGGLSEWWDALAQWDRTYNFEPLNLASHVAFVYSDVTVTITLKRRAAWMVWTKELLLSAALCSVSSSVLN